MEFIKQYLVEEGLAMIAVLYILAEFIKKAEVLDNKLIPLVLLPISLVLTPLLMSGYTADAIVQAVLVTGGAVLYYDSKQGITERDDIE